MELEVDLGVGLEVELRVELRVELGVVHFLDFHSYCFLGWFVSVQVFLLG